MAGKDPIEDFVTSEKSTMIASMRPLADKHERLWFKSEFGNPYWGDFRTLEYEANGKKYPPTAPIMKGKGNYIGSGLTFADITKKAKKNE